jgi:TolA-binding protein
MNKLSTIIIISFLLTSCFKTAEQIKREKEVDLQVAQSAKTIRDLSETIQQLKSQINSTSGQIEEIDHKSQQKAQEQNQTFSQTVLQLSEQVKLLLTDNVELKSKLAKIEKDLEAQRKYIKNVTGTLTKISGPTKRSSGSKLKKAHKAFEKNQKKTAKKLYQELLNEGKINAAQRNHVYFNLGLLDYWAAKYNKALVYFSKIYTKYPRSSFSPRSLLYIARSFKKQNKTAEASAMYQELIKNYPKSSHAATAKKEDK